MSNYLDNPGTFEALINRKFYHFRSAHLDQFLAAMKDYGRDHSQFHLSTVCVKFEDWRAYEPKEFKNRIASVKLEEFVEEMKAKCAEKGLEYPESQEPASWDDNFGTPPAVVVNRHQNKEYWCEEALAAHGMFAKSGINRHKKMKAAAGVASSGTGAGISVAQFATGNAGLMGAAVGGAVVGATGVGLLVGSAVLAVISSGLAIRSAEKTSKHLLNLHRIQDHRHEFKHVCHVEGSQDPDERGHARVMDHLLPYIIEQKSSKLTNKAVSSIPVVGSIPIYCKTGGSNILKRIKGTLGVKRFKAAHWLAEHFCRCDCLATDMIVASLYSVEEMVYLHKHCDYETITGFLADKMKSV